MSGPASGEGRVAEAPKAALHLHVFTYNYYSTLEIY